MVSFLLMDPIQPYNSEIETSYGYCRLERSAECAEHIFGTEITYTSTRSCRLSILWTEPSTPVGSVLVVYNKSHETFFIFFYLYFPLYSPLFTPKKLQFIFLSRNKISHKTAYKIDLYNIKNSETKSDDSSFWN
jgi:hypothetical protein